MAARYSKFFRAAHITGDVFLLNFSFYIVNTVYYNDLKASFTDHYIKQFLYINLFWGVSASFNRVYDLFRVVRFEKVITNLLRTFLIHLLLSIVFIVVFRDYVISYNLFIIKYSLFVVLVICWRLGFMYLLKFIRRQGLNFRNVVILGTGPVGLEARNFFVRHPEHGYHFLSFFTTGVIDESSAGDDVAPRSVKEIKGFALENNVDEIYCAMPDVDHETVKDLMKFSDDNLIRFKLLPDFRGFAGKRMEINFYDDLPVLIARKEPLDNLINRIIKRSFDILFSLFVLVLIFPWLMPLLSLIIIFTSRGPVFFSQWRSGLNNKPFICYKFRSMYLNDKANQLQATRNDSRITPIGKFLRKTSMDEFPQFFNVFLGNMSIVGPRPHMLQHTEKYSKLVDSFMVRHFVKPGITGLAQVRGFRGETTDPMLMEKRVKHDILYIENWSLFFDIKIVLLTVLNMFKGDENAV